MYAWKIDKVTKNINKVIFISHKKNFKVSICQKITQKTKSKNTKNQRAFLSNFRIYGQIFSHNKFGYYVLPFILGNPEPYISSPQHSEEKYGSGVTEIVFTVQIIHL